MPKRLEDYETNFTDTDEDYAHCSIDYCYKISSVPRSYDEAVVSPEANEWKQAMEDEMEALKKDVTFTIVPRQHHEQKPVRVRCTDLRYDGWSRWSRKVQSKIGS